MVADNIFLYTDKSLQYPGYVSLNKRNGKYYISVRNTGWIDAHEIEIPFIEVLKLGSACHGILNMDGD